MVNKKVMIGLFIVIGIFVVAAIGYIAGLASADITMRSRIVSNSIGDLDLQIAALKKARSEKSVSGPAFGQIENLTIISVAVLKSLRPDISKLGFREVLTLCQAESYFHNYGISKSANKQSSTYVVGYLKEILPHLQSRAEALKIPKNLDNDCGDAISAS